MENKFIVKDEREFWLLRKQRQEERIKYFISLGVKAVMSKDGYCVDIISPKRLDKEYTREIIQLAEEYVRTLKELNTESEDKKK
jgi:hypothetical protein